MVVLATAPALFRYVFWTVTIAGVAVFIWRRLKGVPIRGSRENRPENADPNGSGSPRAEPIAPNFPLAAASPPTADVASGSANPVVPPPSPPTATEPTSPSASVSSSPIAPFGSVEAEPPGDPSLPSTRGGFFAGSEPGPSAIRPPEGGPRPTVAEFVRGITMPCALTPVVDGSVSIPNPFRVAFLTTSASAAEVGSSIADELERLGFTLSTSTPTELLARRDGHEMRVVLYPSPGSAKRGLDPIFPVSPAGAIGLELVT